MSERFYLKRTLCRKGMSRPPAGMLDASRPASRHEKNTPACAVWNVLWEPALKVETSRPDVWITTAGPS